MTFSHWIGGYGRLTRRIRGLVSLPDVLSRWTLWEDSQCIAGPVVPRYRRDSRKPREEEGSSTETVEEAAVGAEKGTGSEIFLFIIGDVYVIFKRSKQVWMNVECFFVDIHAYSSEHRLFRQWHYQGNITVYDWITGRYAGTAVGTATRPSTIRGLRQCIYCLINFMNLINYGNYGDCTFLKPRKGSFLSKIYWALSSIISATGDFRWSLSSHQGAFWFLNLIKYSNSRRSPLIWRGELSMITTITLVTLRAISNAACFGLRDFFPKDLKVKVRKWGWANNIRAEVVKNWKKFSGNFFFQWVVGVW